MLKKMAHVVAYKHNCKSRFERGRKIRCLGGAAYVRSSNLVGKVSGRKNLVPRGIPFDAAYFQ